ncbi:mechanosensitive ion channel family protein [Desulfurivibrio alkaliphilus]|uniref:MscS Mechanosensitive ion channel n=1 Tax=Desulfurivibrio alkaliphilus (strain DSM 19089 / UNIQEM U267 / AHT2) TaxID=589865 RepID=D6Z107_DESAT|nr:mechanosensitive ion channel family protein [Desulfurivibrio alkaliphilus]ADH87267.1 MscS Mechanosensitive ion channel [Desulfurivibrio alkaliphilus AHT 2]
MPQLIASWLEELGLSESLVAVAAHLGALLIFLLLAFFSLWVARHWLSPVLKSFSTKSASDWGRVLAEKNFFHRLAHLLPVSVLYFTIDIFFPDTASGEVFRRLLLIAFVLVGLRSLDALLQGLNLILARHPLATGKPIKGYTQALTIIIYVLAGIFVIAIITDKSPWGLLTLMGGLTAVILLVFKDTILGFIASVQLSAHDMVRVGDWISMPQYNADGDVVDVNIHTVKVQNWDRTYATIPTYALVSDAFTNWRGMQESGGRRIMRALYIDMNSIGFCTPEMLVKLSEIELLQDYIANKEQEIQEYNAGHVKKTDNWVNGRHQTNIGVFRAYVTNYLRQHPKIHQEMTFLVRHLQPTPQGLPLEIYVFSREQAWAVYEGVQADIFDHLLAALPHFGLRVFQYPSGFDLRNAGFKAETLQAANEKVFSLPDRAK